MNLYINTKEQNIVTVALKENSRVVKSLSEPSDRGSQVLSPLIIKLLNEEKIDLKDLNGIEIETGPGSFTGLRVGASVAQALGFALNIPVNGKMNKPLDLKYS